MESLSVYIPIDRRQAIGEGVTLPDRLWGATLFADISGFTPLTEALLREYGPKRGAEELTVQLNIIYDALVSEVHRYGGSVLAFSGDAITCWFDGDEGLQATACGLAMQQAMGQLEAIKTSSGETLSLGMKAAVAVGPVRRFLVGDPAVQYIDTLAGATLDNMATAEHYAERGDVVVGPEVAARFGHQLIISEVRRDEETGLEFSVVTGLTGMVIPSPWPDVASEKKISTDQARPWLLPPVFERLKSGQSQFLAEIRPAVALFLRFGGIDYDHDDLAGEKLDNYVCWIQGILSRYGGHLLQLTIGDKGSYLYAAFGAPIAHEDDGARAVSAALEFLALPPELSYISKMKIGISLGQIYAGAYGGRLRRTYGVLGDEVNLAARLMQASEPWEILVSEIARQAAGESFVWESLPAITVKGKSRPIKVFKAVEVKAHQAIRLQEPKYALPMVGRETELSFAEMKLDLAVSGDGQIIGITAEAGMGKSRLVAEIIRLANERKLVGYGGECQSYGTNTSYLVWRPIWSGFFGIDPTWNIADQISELEKQLALIDPGLVPRLPLLGAVLNISIPDNDLTKSFDAKLRKTSLESLLVDCVRARARQTPLLLVLEDGHWLDALSHDLMEVIGRTIVDLPVLMVLAYRPPELERLQAPTVEKFLHFTEIPLTDFTPQESERLISLKLEQFFGAGTDASPALIKRITERAQGNPFYIEELLNYLQDQGFEPGDTAALERLELPTSLHSLILSRMDQLTEQQKNTIKVASVIGRLFEAGWLWGVYPDLGEPELVRANLEVLSKLDLTPQDQPDPEITYIFKHIVTQEVAYESLPYAMRAILHDQFGQFLERRYVDRLERYVDLLAYHFERSQNEPKKREYLRLAGEAAQAEYNNQAAIDYFRRVLPLLPEEAQITVLRKLGEVERLVGRWNEAEAHYNQALALAEKLGDRLAQAWCETAIGQLFWRQGLFTEALDWLDRAQARFEDLDDRAGVGEIWHYEGTISAQQGDLEQARTLWQRSLDIRRELDDEINIANLLSNLAIAARNMGDHQQARELNEQALELRNGLGDKRAVAVSLNNLGQLLTDIGEYETAQTHLKVAVNLQREIGDRFEIANILHNLANLTRDQGDYADSASLYGESLAILWELGERWLLAYVLEDMGGLAALQGQSARALRLVGAATVLREGIGSSLSPAEQDLLGKMLDPARQALGDAAMALEAEGRAMPLEQAVDYARNSSA